MFKEMVNVMGLAFLECLVLVSIHAYLGIHVIKRKIVFIDLALAQIAALGATVAFLFHIMPDSTVAYWISLGFTTVAALLFSIFRFQEEKIPQEAVIGLVYAITAGLMILVIDKAPHGAEHIKETLTGSILWVKGGTIGMTAVIYAGVGIFYYIFRKRFALLSENFGEAKASGIHVRLWDFLFYASFGLVITHSVKIAGVLLVFVFLIAPALFSAFFTKNWNRQLLIGTLLGILTTACGLCVSFIADFPSGPTIVGMYGLVLLCTGSIIKIKQKI